MQSNKGVMLSAIVTVFGVLTASAASAAAATTDGFDYKYYEQYNKELETKVVQEVKQFEMERAKVSSPWDNVTGEIWVSMDSVSSSAPIVVGHAAIVYDQQHTIEAYWGPVSPIHKDGVQYYYNHWLKDKNKIALYGTTNSSLTKRTKAAKFAYSQINKPYSLVPFDKTGESGYYCSKLVYLAWLKQGTDLEYQNMDPYVLPLEIAASKNTILRYSSGF